MVYFLKCAKNHTIIALTATFGLCLNTQKLSCVPLTSHRLAFYHGLIKKNIDLIKRRVFVTLGSYIECMRATVFKFSWKVIFCGIMAEVEQRPKLVSAHHQIPMWSEKCVTEWNSTFCKVYLHYVTVTFWTVSPN